MPHPPKGHICPDAGKNWQNSLPAASTMSVCRGSAYRCSPRVPASRTTRTQVAATGCSRCSFTGVCAYDCAYCSVRLDRPRLAFAPRELAATFLALYQKNLAGGLFLTSGIPYDTDDVMAELVETARILRGEGYSGYLHLKILPGARGRISGRQRGSRTGSALMSRQPGRAGSVPSPGSRTIPAIS